MSSTGEKTSGLKLGSLAMSVDHLGLPGSSASNADIAPQPNDPKDSYAERLSREHGKVLGIPNHEDNELLKQFVDPPSASVLKLETTQILVTELSQKQQWKAGSSNNNPVTETPITLPKEKTSAPIPAKGMRVAKTKAAPILEAPKKKAKKSKKQKPTQASPTKIVAPRAQPFSKKSHVRVKIIVQDIDLNIGHVGTPGSESVTWMQRDAIKQYLTLQGFERRRAAMEGAVYRTVQHDA
jgi:hypothetical protein